MVQPSLDLYVLYKFIVIGFCFFSVFIDVPGGVLNFYHGAIDGAFERVLAYVLNVHLGLFMMTLLKSQGRQTYICYIK